MAKYIDYKMRMKQNTNIRKSQNCNGSKFKKMAESKLPNFDALMHI